ncbi:MAG: 1-deoxy-D-xylulose-5-phosphate synthase [Lachnospiraceae bacterium]|jgi:1-deoxy-D-xylulose-5-phosphate synthase|nr:1-deoxy-D-xylulose-5-phosphate synthase [Lachnospiraceae bacterium]
MGLLDNIHEPNDIKQFDSSCWGELAGEIRSFLIENVSKTGGHLASNLGCVELTMALHLVLNLPNDKIIWDVGHQCYTHKLLTGRREGFETLRQFGGMSGFPKQAESDTDVFDTGHSSTSISAAIGMAKASELKGEKKAIVAVIGDGSFTGGLTYEALNNLGRLKSSCMIVLNDNEMSIDENVGGMSNYLNKIRVGQTYNDVKSGVEKGLLNIPGVGEPIAKLVKRGKDSIKGLLVPGMFFEDLGITYIGPIDGHDVDSLVDTFIAALKLKRPVVVHVKTVKGKGYRYAEKHPKYFHGVKPFDIKTGKVIEKQTKMTNTGVFGRKMLALGEEYPNLIAITAAMASGTGLDKFSNVYPKRFFDVGIAEQHAVTFAAGLAKEGMIPVVAVYSSFLQRAYDQILHDVCLQKQHVVFAIDRSGLVGEDGSTHQGIFDTAYLCSIPGMTVIAPKNRYELTKSLEYAMEFDGPIAIKYSKGDAFYGLKDNLAPIELGKSEIIAKGKKIALIAVGNMVEEACKVYEKLLEDGKEITFVNARFIKPLDTEMLDELAKDHDVVITLEEHVYQGGFGQMVSSYYMQKSKEYPNITVRNIAINDTFVEHGSVTQLREMLGIDYESVLSVICEYL